MLLFQRENPGCYGGESSVNHSHEVVFSLENSFLLELLFENIEL